MNTKTASNLSSFMRKTTAAPVSSEVKVSERNSAELKKLSLRLTREQWIRVSHLSLELDKSVQQMALEGISRLFTDRGLPPL
ncbi:MAG: hypothetical protein WCK63_16395 [Betaproteobacteria bacterium]